jgi:alcohol dehydrogenase (NADP+)
MGGLVGITPSLVIICTLMSTGRRYIDYLDTWGAMALLKEKGKARHLGVSNFSPHQMETLLNRSSHVPAVHQMELHPYLQQPDWVEWHQKHNIHVTVSQSKR